MDAKPDAPLPDAPQRKKPRVLRILDTIIIAAFILDILALILDAIIPSNSPPMTIRLSRRPASILIDVVHPLAMCVLFGTAFIRMIWVLFKHTSFSLGLMLGFVVWLGLAGTLVFSFKDVQELRLTGIVMILLSLFALWLYTREREPK